MPIKLSYEGLDVGNIVKSMMRERTGFAEEIESESIYSIGNIAVNFQRHGDTVIMRLVEKQIPEFKLEFYGVCKHGGPGVGFPCEECRQKGL